MGAKLRNISAMLIFGTIGIFVKNIELASSEIALLRGIIGGIVLIIVSILLKNKIEMKIVLNTKRIHNSVNGEIKSTAFFITIKELPQIRADINSIHLPNISFFIYSLTYNLVNNNTVRFIFHYKIVF